MPPRDSVEGTLIIAAVLCFVCSLMVASARVSLKPIQDTNKALSTQKTLLELTGVIKEGEKISADEVRTKFEKTFEPHIVDLKTGEYSKKDEDEQLKKSWDIKKMLLDKANYIELSPKEDLPGIKVRENEAKVFLIKDSAGKIEQIILPIRGKGLWSTLWGYIALKSDTTTVNGIVFNEHAETPGLGGEIDNKGWREKWIGKEIPYENNKVEISAVKGLDPKSPEAKHQFDSLSGATITSRGVEYTLKFWLGDKGFRPYLEKLHQ